MIVEQKGRFEGFKMITSLRQHMIAIASTSERAEERYLKNKA